MATTERTPPSVAVLLAGILLLELLGLVPWAVFSALSTMGFDTGFSWKVFFAMFPFLAYPVLILICAVIAFAQNKRGRVRPAIIAMLAPITSWAYFFLIMIFAD